jgi:hypothetical protein
MKKKSIKNPITIERGRLAALLRKERELYYLKERGEYGLMMKIMILGVM